mmetsp:Transcript_53354/g.133945  ORF Transcript_53354/g.133945 Transcript_53354/m.133945 type:complete len:170 (-) Transcript_53354:162-671(-)|eukprot:CAMPEP_0177660686 /NCGR_PEP_ID=MMETSP0447-20121125/18195_1 /TAXON_ID=0 /ORGANISM="Stygamoeba regulata, Strain BSH-02190019" /LENGTH=169 /DNA_ID=CAMNT_0019165813 /DNA_START=286 /DNA_END=795 /DNA_ORIENTATION=-
MAAESAAVEATANTSDAFFLASKQGRADDIKDLLEPPFSINPDILDVVGNSALHYASGGNHVDIVSMLIEKGANMNIKNRVGDTPLHKAAEKASLEAAQLLVSRGASTAIRNDLGFLPVDLSKYDDLGELLTPVEEGGGDDNEEDILPNDEYDPQAGSGDDDQDDDDAA